MRKRSRGPWKVWLTCGCAHGSGLQRDGVRRMGVIAPSARAWLSPERGACMGRWARAHGSGPCLRLTCSTLQPVTSMALMCCRL